MTKFELAIYASGNTHVWSVHTVEAETKEDAIRKFKTVYGERIMEAEEYYSKGDKKAEIQVLSWADILPLVKAEETNKYITGISEITGSHWDDMLNCLPPEKWLTVSGVNIFRMMEYQTSNITAHYMQAGKRFFTAMYRTTIDYKEIAKNVKEFALNTPTLMQQFKDMWEKDHKHISIEISDKQISAFINNTPSIEKACDIAADHLLANGIADVQE